MPLAYRDALGDPSSVSLAILSKGFELEIDMDFLNLLFAFFGSARGKQTLFPVVIV